MWLQSSPCWMIRTFLFLFLCENVLGGERLEDLVYQHSVGDHWCIHMLNASTSLGCSSSDQGRGVVGALWGIGLDALPDDAMYNYSVVVPHMGQVGPLIQRVMMAHSKGKRRFSSILVGSHDNESEYIGEWNWDSTRPLSKFQREGREHVWNPRGLSISGVDIPMVLLSPAMTLSAVNRSLFNLERYKKGSGPLFVSHIHHHMLAQGAANSTACLEKKTCLPTGGFSILAGTGPKGAQTILIISRLDTFEFFHGIRTAHDGPDGRPGLCAMLLVASRILSHEFSFGLKRRVVFAALQSESIDFTGSRRLVYELDSNNRFVKGMLRMSDVEAVIDMSGLDLGRAMRNSDGKTSLYAHINPHERDHGALSKSIVARLRQSLSLLSDTIDLQAIQSHKNGLPPTSGRLFGFLYPELPIVSLTEYASEYTDEASRRDRIQLITSVASSLSETLLLLLTGSETRVDVSSEEAKRLMACISSDEDFRSLDCDITEEMPFGGPFDTTHMKRGYPGIVRFMTEDSAIHMYDTLQSSLERFVWNYMVPMRGTAGKPCNAKNATLCPEMTMCGGRTSRQGEEWATCVSTPPLFVPAFSYYMEYSHGWLVNTSGAQPWEASFQLPPDPMLVESNWETGQPSLTVYMTEDPSTNTKIFITGMCATAITAFLTFLHNTQ